MDVDSDTATALMPLSSQQQDDILRNRLSTDDKHVRRIAKRIAVLVQSSSSQDREAAALLLQSDLDLFSEHISKLHSIANTTSTAEMESYEQEMTALRTCPYH